MGEAKRMRVSYKNRCADEVRAISAGLFSDREEKDTVPE
jgi:hypothetical protein